MRQSLFTVVLVLAGLWVWQGPAKSWRAARADAQQLERCKALLASVGTPAFDQLIEAASQADIRRCLEPR